MRIVLVGDNITFGDNASKYKNSWAGRLEEYLNDNFKGKFEVINSAIQGETAKEGFERIEDSVIKYIPDIVFIGYGTNDCTKVNGQYENDFYTFESNIVDITKKVKSQTNASIVFNLASPVIEELSNDDVVTIHNRDIKLYNDVVKKVCGSMMFSFIDHFQIIMNKNDLTNFIDRDGIHPNDEGHRLIFENILGSAGHLFR